MLNIVIPMAGHGSRFQKAGYSIPKPLIPIHGQPMISWVINNIRPDSEHRFIFLCLEKHLNIYDLENQLINWAPNSEIIPVKTVTEGAACTVLLAKHLINNNNELMIANSDQWINYDINTYLKFIALSEADGAIMTMVANDPKWSYIRFTNKGLPCEVVEKKVVSNEATVGIYNFRYGSDFVDSAEKMIANNFRVNGEFYVAPVYNQMLKEGKKIIHHNIGKESDGMYGLGIPDDLTRFKNSAISECALAQLVA